MRGSLFLFSMEVWELVANEMVNRKRRIKNKEITSGELLYVYFVDSEGQKGKLPIEVSVKYFNQFLSQYRDIYLVVTNSKNEYLFEVQNYTIFKTADKYRESIYKLMEEWSMDRVKQEFLANNKSLFKGK